MARASPPVRLRCTMHGRDACATILAARLVLNAADNSARFSHDFDIFHELAEEVDARQQSGFQSIICSQWLKDS